MNGFERSSGQDCEADALEPLFPDDYSPEDAEIAHELHALFPIEREVLPPLYVQTLMDDPWSAPVTPSQERTLVSGVFERLRVMREPLLAKLPVLPSWPSLVETIAQVSTLSRSVVAAASMALAAILFSVVLTGPAFAAGLWLLLGHTGVQQVSVYPTSAHVGVPGTTTQLARPQFPVSWLGRVAGDYSYMTTRYDQSEAWSKGPVVELQYRMVHSAGGAGILDVREFQVADRYAAVLQVVKAGSATQVQLGDMPAIYVDGGWATLNGRAVSYHTWRNGVRSFLLFERDGVVYWIVADQRDSCGQSALLALASHLQPASARDLTPNRLTMRALGDELPAQLDDPVGDEVYALIPAGVSPSTGPQSLVQFESRTRLTGSGTGMGGPS